MNAERLLQHYEQIADAPDAIARLRRFILDLAMRGKLVPQDSQDEPASELLKRIAAEKARRLMAGEIRKEKFLSPVHLAQSPGGWSWTCLGSATIIVQGFAFSSGDFTIDPSAGYPLIKIGDIGGNSPETYIKGSPDPNYLVKSGDILLGLSGSIKCALWKGPDALLNQRIARIASLTDDLHVTWLLFAVNSCIDKWKEETSKLTVQNVKAAQLYEAVIPLPPLAEQHRIVAKVDELMALCDQLEAARMQRETKRDRLAAASLARLNTPDPETVRDDARFTLDALPAITARPDQIKQLRQTILNLAVRGKLVPQDPVDEPADVIRVADVGDDEGRLNALIPSSWQWVRVADVADARLGKMLDKAKNHGKPYPYLRNTNVHWFDVRLDDLKLIPLSTAEFEEYQLRRGDVLICEGGHGIGRTAVWKNDISNVVFQKALHRVRPGPTLNSDFFSFCCLVYYEAGVMQTYFTGVGIPHFTGRALSKLVFPLPPLAEQHRIVGKVDELMALCDQLETSLTSADETRKKLLDALLAEALAPLDAVAMQEAAE